MLPLDEQAAAWACGVLTQLAVGSAALTSSGGGGFPDEWERGSPYGMNKKKTIYEEDRDALICWW